MLKLYGAIRSTSLDKCCYILYTRSVSRSSLSSGFKLESLPPTAAAAKFHSYHYGSATILGHAKTTMGRWGYIDNTQSVNCDCGERKQLPTSSVAGYLMSLAPRKTSPSSQRGQRHVPRCGNTMCEGQKRSATVDWEQFVPN